MSKRKRTGLLEDLLDLAALLPWWLDVVIAALIFIGLHRYVAAPVPVSTDIAHAGGMVVTQMFKTLASIGQWLIPLAFLIGAGVSAWKRHQRKQLLAQAAAPNGAQAVDGLSWQDFERLIGEAFRRRGFTVAETGGGGADGGVDLVLTKGGEKSLVQCKHWRAQQVGVAVVRELYGVMAARGATGGFVVTSGSYSNDARAFAQGRNVELIDGPALTRMLREAQADKAPAPAAPVVPATPAAASVPNCPLCNAPMVQRVARQGANAGKPFWGCSNFAQTKCRGTRPIA